jgi:hypothetical protein
MRSLGCFRLKVFVRSFDQLAVFEYGADPDEGNEVRCVDRAPAVLCSFDEFECHGQSSGSGAQSLGDLRAVSNDGEGRFNRVSRAQVNPVFCGIIVEREQLVKVVGDLRSGLGELGAVAASSVMRPFPTPVLPCSEATTMVISTLYLPGTAVNVRTSTYCREVSALVRPSIPS